MTDTLPSLPPPYFMTKLRDLAHTPFALFSAEQMRAYAAAAVAAEREACATHIDVPWARPGAEFAAAIRARKP